MAPLSQTLGIAVHRYLLRIHSILTEHNLLHEAEWQRVMGLYREVMMSFHFISSPFTFPKHRIPLDTTFVPSKSNTGKRDTGKVSTGSKARKNVWRDQ